MSIVTLSQIADGPVIFEREKFFDARGSFEMVFQIEEMKQIFPDLPEMIQFNLLNGVMGSLRGFHGASIEKNHWKILTCAKGVVKDAVLDLRKESLTFGKIALIEISADSKKTLVIPPGFAHGVQSLTENSLTIYGTNIPYRLNNEFEINPLSGNWFQLWENPVILSKRDSNAPLWVNYLNHENKSRSSFKE